MTEYRFEARIEREPSCELIVFWRLTCGKEEPEEVEAREGVCSIVAAIAAEAAVDMQSRAEGAISRSPGRTSDKGR